MRALPGLIAAAMVHMPVDRAEELARNVSVGLAELDLGGSDESERLNYLVQSIRHREQHFGLVVADAHAVAVALASAWSAERLLSAVVADVQRELASEVRRASWRGLPAAVRTEHLERAAELRAILEACESEVPR